MNCELYTGVRVTSGSRFSLLPLVILECARQHLHALAKVRAVRHEADSGNAAIFNAVEDESALSTIEAVVVSVKFDHDLPPQKHPRLF